MINIKNHMRPLMVGVFATVALYCSGFLVIFTPLPIFYLAVAYNKEISRLVFLLALLMVIALYWVLFPASSSLGGIPLLNYIMMLVPGWRMTNYFDPTNIQIFGSLYFVCFCLFGLMLSEGVSRKWSAPKWIFMAVAVSLGFSFGVAGILNVFGIINIGSAVDAYIGLVVQEIIKMSGDAAQNDAQFRFIVSHLEQVSTTVVRLIPAAILVFAIFTVLCNVLIGGRLTRGRTSKGEMVNELVAWAVPSWFIWALISSGVCFYINHYFIKIDWLKYAAINVLLVLGAVYFLQGLAILAFYLRKWSSVFFKVLAYALILIFLQTTAIGLVLVGVADYWLDFRRTQGPKNFKKRYKNVFNKE